MCKKEEQIDIAFLFGAGAEIDFGLSGGGDFAKIVAGDKRSNNKKICNMNTAIKTYYKRTLDEWYPTYCEYTFDEDKLFKAAIKKKFLDEEYVPNNKKGFEDLIANKAKSLRSQKEKIIDNYTSYMGILDGIFHTLISPKYLGPNRFWGVVGCYTRAYLLLTGEMLGKIEKRPLSNKDYLKILESPLEYYKKWEYISSEKDTYYDVLKKYKENHKFAIVTTNYTPICNNITKIEDIAYVNGKLNWFESPYELKVYDITELNNNANDVFFPYIFVQSGIKPIIEEKQINEYAKMSKYFQNSSTIIVVGYRINADDNHINSFLRSAIYDDKKIIYFNHNNNLSEEQIRKRLRLKKPNSNIDIVNVNDDNCISKFEEVIKSLN